MMNDKIFDIAVIGGGVNGVGIARDAIGRLIKAYSWWAALFRILRIWSCPRSVKRARDINGDGAPYYLAA